MVARRVRKNAGTKSSKKKTRIRSRVYVKDKTVGVANHSGKIMNLMSLNRSPIPLKRKLVLKYNSYCSFTTSGGGVSSDTWFLNLASLYDPNYQATNTAFSNTSTNGYTEFFGLSPMQYRKFRLDYVDVQLKVLNTTSGTVGMLVVSASNVGTADYPNTQFIQNIASRRGAISQSLEYFGDSNYKTLKFRIYPWEVMGMTKQQYYSSDQTLTAYNVSGAQSPWLAFSLADGAQPDGSGGVLLVRGQIYVEQHVTAHQPNLLLVD